MSQDKEKIRSLIVSEVYVESTSSTIVGSNGLQSPWMFDFKKILLSGDFLSALARIFLDRYSSQYPFQVAGLEVGSIPIIAAITIEAKKRGLEVNGFFIRKSRKKTGTMSMIEGSINSEPVILVDDLINSGKSFLQQVILLEELKAKQLITTRVTDIFTILSFKSVTEFTIFSAKEIKLSSLFELFDFQQDLGLTNISNDAESKTKLIDTELVWRRLGSGANFSLALPRSELLVTQDCIYLGDDNGNLICLNKKTGEEVWSYLIPLGSKKAPAFSSPVISGEIIVFGSRDGNVYAINAKTGKRVWVYLEADWLLGSPAVCGDSVFIPLSFGLFKKQGKVVSLNTKTGKKEWEYNIESPVIGGISYFDSNASLAFGSEDRFFHSIDAKNGKLNWTKKIEIKPRGYPVFLSKLRLVAVSGVSSDEDDRGRVYIFDNKSGEIKSTFQDFNFGSYSTACVDNNNIFFSALDKHLYKIDLNGKLIWKVNLNARCFASPIVVKFQGLNIIVVGANNGYLYFIESETGNIINVIIHTERIINKVALDENSAVLYVPTQAGDIYTYKLKV